MSDEQSFDSTLISPSFPSAYIQEMLRTLGFAITSASKKRKHGK